MVIKNHCNRTTATVSLSHWQRSRLTNIPFEGRNNLRYLAESDWKYVSGEFYLFQEPVPELRNALSFIKPDRIGVKFDTLTGYHEFIIEAYDDCEEDIPF